MYSTVFLLQGMGSLKRIASEKEPGQAIYAEHKLAKKRFIARYLWEPMPEIRPQFLTLGACAVGINHPGGRLFFGIQRCIFIDGHVFVAK